MKLLPNITIIMNPQAKLLDFAVCQSYRDMTDNTSLDKHLFQLVDQYAISKQEIEQIVAGNPVVVTDICCDNCQQYFLPNSVDELLDMRKLAFYRCENCEIAAYRAGSIPSHSRQNK